MLTNRFIVSAVLAAAAFCAAGPAMGDTTIDASLAKKVTLPAAGSAPVTFTTPDGKQGWVRKISNERIPTPAYANGKIYTGLGVSNTMFMAIDAMTGATVWSKQGRENGPTSPVIEDGIVSYNTESCDTESRYLDSGDMVWEETTGGSLLTQPVIADGALIIPHPTMARTAHMPDSAYRMLAADAKTGKHQWDAPMTGDVMGAPIAAAGRVFFACTDGRLFSMNVQGGGSSWHAVAEANSAPVVVGSTLAVTTEAKGLAGGVVSIQRFNVRDGKLLDEKGLMPVSVSGNAIEQRRAGWDYQGPKIAANGNALFNAPGEKINSLDIATGKALWQTTLKGDGIANAADTITPPALGKQNLYVGTSRGHVMGIRQSDGHLVFAYNVGQPLGTQVLLAGGNIYFGTETGMLVCIKLNNPDADGWTAWGGNAQHNKVD